MIYFRLYLRLLSSGIISILLFSNSIFAQVYDIATEDGNTVNTCSGTFTDSDDFDSDSFLNNEDYVVTFCSDQAGSCLTMDFSSFEIDDPQDWLYIWDGSDTTSGDFIGAFNNPFGNNSNNILSIYPDGIQSVSGCFTFYFHSDSDFITGSGWEASISCYSPCVSCVDGIQNGTETGVDCGGACADCPEPINIVDGGTVNTCGSLFTDSGGLIDDYSNNESNTITICSSSANPSFCLNALFTEFDTEENWDYLFIYDGNSTSSPLIGSYTGNNSPGSIAASGSCLTFFFTSDSQIANFDGWSAELVCGECADIQLPSIADCIGALPICQDVQNEDTPLDGAGNVINELPANDCFMAEVDVLWYIFDVETDGIFNFTIDAVSQYNGDYDWVVYDITDLSCDNITTATSVSCNTWGDFTNSYLQPTGISTLSGGSGTVNGPGTMNGPSFNEDLDVLSGETYALVISNCCGATAGFEIDFGASTAEIYDSYSPNILDVTSSCGNNQISIEFDELIDCSTISELDFEIFNQNDNYSILNTSSDWCDNGTEGTFIIDVFIDGVMENNESYTLTITSSDGGVADMCGNVLENESFTFTTSSAIMISSVLTTSDCASTSPNGGASISVSGGEEPYYVEIGNQNDYDVDVFVFDQLSYGIQQVEVYDVSGCHATFYIDVPSANSNMDNEIISANVSCLGGDGFFEVNTAGGTGFGPWNYILEDSLGNTIASATDTNYFYVDNLEVASYFLSIEDLSGLSDCPDMQEVVISEADPVILSSTSDTTICYNGQAALFAWVESGNTSSPFTIYWQSDSDSFTTNPLQVDSTDVLTSSISYLVYAEDDLGCYSDSLIINILVADLLSFSISPDQVICPGTSVEIDVNSITGGYGLDYNVIWTIENGESVEANSVVVQPDSATTYCVNVSDICETPAIDSCVTITPSAIVPVSFSIDTDTSGCPPLEVSFTNTTNPQDFEFATWYFGDGGQSNETGSVSHNYNLSGVYNVALSIVTSDLCVFDTLWQNAIYIYPLPNPFFVMTPQITTIENTTIEFNNQSVGASSYYWIFDTVNNLGVSYDENPSFSFPDLVGGNYYIQLFASNIYDCVDSVTQTLIVRDKQTLYIPNSFSPNGDGDNDYFFVKGVELDPNVFHLLIYDRWGSIVFETKDLNERWNGSVKGSAYYAQPGVFVYHLKYQVNGTLDAKEIIGSVTLLK